MRLLICDDHQLFLEAVGRALAARGHEVVGVATDPWRAAELVAELAPDICVMDLGFPNADGLDTVRVIRERAPDVKVLVLSGSIDARTAWSVLHAGAHGFLGKDQPVEHIFVALGRLADGELVFDLALLRETEGAEPAGARDHLVIRSLTPREREVLTRLLRAETTAQISEHMGITSSTARAYVQTVLMKLGVHSRLQAVALVTRLGLTDQLGQQAAEPPDPAAVSRPKGPPRSHPRTSAIGSTVSTVGRLD